MNAEEARATPDRLWAGIRLTAGKLTIVGLVGGLVASGVIMSARKVIITSADTSFRTGLEYDVFLSTVDTIIRAGQGQILERHEVEMGPGRSLGAGSEALDGLVIDTLAVVADTLVMPSFERGAYLRDEVERFNAFEIRRAEFGARDPELFTYLEGRNPSIFRVRDTIVETAAAAWNLRVPPPNGGRWREHLLARDAKLRIGLVGPNQVIPLDTDSRLEVEVGEGTQTCEFRVEGDDIVVFCESDQPIPQLTFRGIAAISAPTEQLPGGYVVAGWELLRVDDEAVRQGDSIMLTGGEIIEIAPLPPLKYGVYWSGALSARSWSNGRSRRWREERMPLDVLSRLGATGLPRETGDIRLSVDAEASLALTSELGTFLETWADEPLDFAVAMVADISTGEILSLGEVGARRESGRGAILQNLVPGSTFKPMLAAAVLSERPELASLRIPARGAAVRCVAEMPCLPERQAFDTRLYCEYPASGYVDLEYFLRCSSNEFAATLMARAIGDPSVLNGYIVPREALTRSRVSVGMNSLYAVQGDPAGVPVDPTILNANRFTPGFWRGVWHQEGNNEVSLPEIEFPRSVRPDRSSPILLSSIASEGTSLSLLYRWSIGAWENRWTLPDLVQSFGRVVTDTELTLTVGLMTDHDVSGPFDWLGGPYRRLELRGPDNDWYPTILRGLRRVGEDGTAPGLNRALGSIAAQGEPALVAYSKTGTLNERRDHLFVKAILFAVGEPAPDEASLGCGFTGAVYVKWRDFSERSLPDVPVDFAKGPMRDHLEQLWRKYPPC